MKDLILSMFGSAATALAIIVAIIGLAGALGGAATSYFIGQQTVYVNSITAERMKWITALRERIASFMTQAGLMVSLAKGDGPVIRLYDDIEKLANLRNTIALQLNPHGLVDGNVIAIADAMISAMRDQKEIEPLSQTLRLHTQWLLKMEWERVKSEARSPINRLISRRKFRKLEGDYCDLLRSGRDGMSRVRRLQPKTLI